MKKLVEFNPQKSLEILFFKANGLTVSVFSQSMTADAVLSLVVAISTLSVAIISPPLGVIADRRLVKMRWLKILTIVGAGGTFLIAIAPFLGNAAWIWIMVMYLFANIGLNGAGVFYNALLPHLGKPDELDDISNRAFAYGYLGAGVLLVLHLIILLATDFAEWAVQFSLASSGVWWYGFALITFAWVPEPPVENEMEKLKFRDAARFAVGEVKQTLKDYKDFPQLFLYMLAYFLFIDGINTVTALGGVYGTTVLGIGFIKIIARNINKVNDNKTLNKRSVKGSALNLLPEYDITDYYLYLFQKFDLTQRTTPHTLPLNCSIGSQLKHHLQELRVLCKEPHPSRYP